jgi:hypothetical protein
MKKIVTLIIQIALLAVIVFFAYSIVKGIQKPIDFEVEREARFEKVIDRLKDIRTAQVEFKKRNSYYTPDFDTLINFIKTEEMPVVRKEGFVPDTLTEKEAVELGIVTRDTIFIPYMDTLFNDIDYNIDSMAFIPVGTKAKFAMDTNTVMTGSKVEVMVFEARIPYWDVMDGMDEQLIINYNSEKMDIASVNVHVNDEEVLNDITMSTGSGPLNFDFNANEGDTIRVYYTEGAWTYENYIDIIDDKGNVVLDKHYPDETRDGNWIGVTERAGTYTIRLYDEHGDGWYGGIAVGSLKEATNNAGNWE